MVTDCIVIQRLENYAMNKNPIFQAQISVYQRRLEQMNDRVEEAKASASKACFKTAQITIVLAMTSKLPSSQKLWRRFY